QTNQQRQWQAPLSARDRSAGPTIDPLAHARRLMKHQHECVVYDQGADSVKAMVKEGATGTSSLADLVKALGSPKVIWLMVPAGEATESTVAALGKILPRGSTIIDGGNSFTKTMFAGTRTSRKRG